MIIDSTLGPDVQQAAINFSASGNNTVITGSPNTKIKVLQMFFGVGAADTIQFYSGSTAISGPITFAAAGSFFMDYIQLPLQTVNDGDSFIINSGTAVAVGGTVWYIQS